MPGLRCQGRKPGARLDAPCFRRYISEKRAEAPPYRHPGTEGGSVNYIIRDKRHAYSP